MYDFAHCLSDAIEGITHSLCTLEFEVHRPLYDWFLEHLAIPQPRPQQIEFAPLNISHTLLSKRKLKYLIEKNIIDGWDDPRIATIAALRRRGYTPTSIRNFCKSIGVTKVVSSIDRSRLEEMLRQDLNASADRVMVVLDPILLKIVNYPEGKEEEFIVSNNPEQEDSPAHCVRFSRNLYIERDDFLEHAPKNFFRLSVGREVRLKHAYYITCTNIIKDVEGNIVEIHAEYDPCSYKGQSPDGRKVKGTLHWVSVEHAVDVAIDAYEELFEHKNPEQIEIEELLDAVNPNSYQPIRGAKAESFILELLHRKAVQFLRKGYYIYDETASKQSKQPHFIHTVSLKEGWKPK
ncbi:glutamine--tRNA ligase-like [Ylistrum balloti]|uniref:glutamine--tRNA ligase-like n=1 Tax=Ylistrum balloti TaxID=509963 RepID=UPI0029058746|nr:glutamine--tRNA ligase-like [Ylistrum balloti]